MPKQHLKKSKKRKIRSRIPPRPLPQQAQIVPETGQSSTADVLMEDALLKAASDKPKNHVKRGFGQFPKNTRFITDSFKNLKNRLRSFWGKQKKRIKLTKEVVLWVTVGVACILFVLVLFQAQNLWQHSQEKEKKDQGRAELLRQIAYWQEVVSKYKDYRDGYYNIALLAYRLGEDNRAEEYIQKALDLDPNFKQGKELEAIIKNER